MISARLEKSLKPMSVSDTSNITVGEAFKPFAKSLIHVIRNSVDHGIETPEERVENGKDEFVITSYSIHYTKLYDSQIVASPGFSSSVVITSL